MEFVNLLIVETSAPGESIITTSPGNGYQNVSSTSLAAAHVAGALALAVNKHYGQLTSRNMLEAFVKPEASDVVESMKFETICSVTMGCLCFEAFR